MRKVYLLIYILIFINGYGQDYTQYYFKNLPKSPSTSTFLRYGDIQNNEYTGTLSPKIDIFLIESGNIKIPLVLKYVSGNGIKVADEATSVGLGWDISFPTISQMVMGGYDDFEKAAKYLPPFTYSSNPYNNYFPHVNSNLPNGFVQVPGPQKYSYFKSIDGFLPLGNTFSDLSAYLSLNIDTSPDIFVCNLFGEKLEFVISNYPPGLTSFQNGLIQYPVFYSLNKKGYKISYDSNSLFTITDPLGTKYFFQKVEKNTIGKTVAKNYRLTKIVDFNNNKVTLDYYDFSSISNIPPIAQKLNFTYSTQFTDQHVSSLPYAFIFSDGGYDVQGEYDTPFDVLLPSLHPFTPAANNSFFIPQPLNYPSSQNYLLIKSISGNFGEIDFYYSDRTDFPTKKMDGIEIKNKYNKTVKNVSFQYDYFGSNNSPNITSTPIYGDQIAMNYQSIPNDRLTKRLKLNSININDEKYSFEYDGTIFPPKHSIAIDYWGYSNGGTSNKTIFLNPQDFNYSVQIPVENQFNNNFKQANLSFCQSGILKKIIYPTKGYSEFEYELNSADNLFNPLDNPKINLGNGVRLKSQSNSDWDGTTINKTIFEYFNGKDMNPLFLFTKYRTVRTASDYLHIRIFTNNSDLVSMNSATNSASPLASGNFVGYSTVIRKDVDLSNNSKGRTETNFVNNSDYHYFNFDDRVPVDLPSTISAETENAKIISQSVYNKNGDKLSQTDNNYSTIFSNTYYGTSLSPNSRYAYNYSTNCAGCGPFLVWNHGISVLAYFPIFSKESILKTSIKKDYFNGRTVETRTDYDYNSNNFITHERISSAGVNSGQGTSYATEWNIPQLIDANIIRLPIYKEYQKDGRDEAYLTIYGNTNDTNPTSVVRQNQRINGSLSSSDIVVKYIKYDNKGNLLEYKNISDMSTAIVWGYNQSLPIAKVEGATYSQISSFTQAIIDASNSDIDETTEKNFINELDNFRNSLAKYPITTYTYDPLIGVTSITPPSGIREVYKYDSNNRLKEEKNLFDEVLKLNKYNLKP